MLFDDILTKTAKLTYLKSSQWFNEHLSMVIILHAGPLESSFLPPHHYSHSPPTQQGQNHQGYHCLVALVLR